MKKYILSIVFILCSLGLFAQSSDVKIGDMFVIGKVENNQYQHIHFPKLNFIIKRGGVASFKNVVNTFVVVKSIETNENGTSILKLKRADGGRFFGSHEVVTADYKKALETGELRSK